MFLGEKPRNSGGREGQRELSRGNGQVERLERLNLFLKEHQHRKGLSWTYTRYIYMML